MIRAVQRYHRVVPRHPVLHDEGRRGRPRMHVELNIVADAETHDDVEIQILRVHHLGLDHRVAPRLEPVARAHYPCFSLYTGTIT